MYHVSCMVTILEHCHPIPLSLLSSMLSRFEDSQLVSSAASGTNRHDAAFKMLRDGSKDWILTFVLRRPLPFISNVHSIPPELSKPEVANTNLGIISSHHHPDH
ncbi:hypothetical protein BofuT4_P076190.1 [Botrytis cinerea T4]|uniref:Uncharacterized protein n=1 Tax=Botryotinia fuckeliana (strain T4) TaxID=999810 RepID=G2XNT0_BOTF4|nr:hypothetical protein BofuT4_P076190.1 [Botrytis cinerea T4]